MSALPALEYRLSGKVLAQDDPIIEVLMPLTKHEREFVEHYVDSGCDDRKVFQIFNFKKSPTQKAVSAYINKMTAKPRIRTALQAIMKRSLEKVEKAIVNHGITKEKIIEEIAKIAFSDVRSLMEWNEAGVQIKPSHTLSPEASGAVAKVVEFQGKDGPQVRIETHDKLRALESLGKSLGLFQEKVQEGPKVAVQLIIEKADADKIQLQASSNTPALRGK